MAGCDTWKDLGHLVELTLEDWIWEQEEATPWGRHIQPAPDHMQTLCLPKKPLKGFVLVRRASDVSLTKMFYISQ